MECDWKDIRSVRALLVHITQLHLPIFLFYKEVWPFGYIIDTIYCSVEVIKYQREIEYTEEYGGV